MGALKEKGLGDQGAVAGPAGGKAASTAPPARKESKSAADYAQFERDMQEFL
jgi:hypothetical protein